MPFCTLKPSWYFRSGRLMRTVVTGGQLTMFIFTWTWFFKPWNTDMDFYKQRCVECRRSTMRRTLMIPWQVASGSPTRLVLLMDMIWSPMLSLPERAAGPPFIMLAKMTVGRMEPQPDSTITTPRISPLFFSSCSCEQMETKICWALLFIPCLIRSAIGSFPVYSTSSRDHSITPLRGKHHRTAGTTTHTTHNNTDGCVMSVVCTGDVTHKVTP